MTKIVLAILSVAFVIGCSPVKEDNSVPAPPTAQALSHDLYQAIADQDVNYVEQIVDSGADLTMYDERGYTPLMRAVQIGNSFIVESIISGGAKIYQPRKDDSGTSAFGMVTESGSEMHRLFEAERVRLAGVVQSKIIKGEFEELVTFSKENHLPVLIQMPGSGRSALAELAAADKPDQKYTEYLIEGIEASDEVSMAASVEVLNKIQKTEFLEFLVAKYIDTDFEKNFVEAAAVPQSGNLVWAQEKLVALERKGVEVDINTYLEDVRPILADVDQRPEALKLVKQIVGLDSSLKLKAQFIAKVLNTLLLDSGSQPKNLEMVSKLGELWGTLSTAPATDYSLDDMVTPLLAGVRGKEYDSETFKSVIKDLKTFTGPSPTGLGKAMEDVISGEFVGQQERLLRDLLRTVKQLPPGIVAYSMRNSELDLDLILLDSGVKLNVSEQSDAINAAIESKSSGGAVLEALSKLQSRGFFTGSPSEAESVVLVFQKLWETKDPSFQSVVSFLAKLPTSPIGLVDAPEIVSLLKTHIRFLGQVKGDWWVGLDEVLRQMQVVDKRQVSTYQQQISINDKQSEVKVSVVWDLILFLHERFREGSASMPLMRKTILTALRKFPGQEFGMGAADKFDVPGGPDRFYNEKMLPLSLLLFSGPKALEDSPLFPQKGPDGKGRRGASNFIRLHQTYVDWKKFAENPLFVELSKSKEYWKSISELLVASNLPFVKSDGGKTAAELTMLAFKEEWFTEFPGLAAKFNNLTIVEDPDEYRPVILKDVWAEAGWEPFPKVRNLVSDNVAKNQTGGFPSETGVTLATQGVTEFLTLFVGAAQNSRVLSKEELLFAKNFFEANFKPTSFPDGPSYYPPAVIKCSKYEEKISSKSDYSRKIHDSFGSLVAVDPNSEEELVESFRFHRNEQCYVFPFDEALMNQAKLMNLYWLHRTVESMGHDSDFLEYLNGLDAKLGFKTITGEDPFNRLKSTSEYF